jgi:hypothetical protein
MSNWQYDSGGHEKDNQKYRENYEKIFGGQWPCSECENKQSQGHKMSCSQHWKNKAT